jgi:hypothetical protein
MADLTLKTAVTATTNVSKFEYALNAQEKLRVEHNAKGKDFTDGKISKEEWETWKKEYFDPRSKAISISIGSLRESLLKSNAYAVDLERDFE